MRGARGGSMGSPVDEQVQAALDGLRLASILDRFTVARVTFDLDRRRLLVRSTAGALVELRLDDSRPDPDVLLEVIHRQ